MLQTIRAAADHHSRAAFLCRNRVSSNDFKRCSLSRRTPFRAASRPCSTTQSASRATINSSCRNLRSTHGVICKDLDSVRVDRPSEPPFNNCFQLCLGVLTTCSITATLLLPSWAWAELPPEPQIGDCPDCLGEVNGALNACRLDSSSCVSTENDDADHFIAPWTFEVPRDRAVEELLSVAQGGEYDAGLVAEPYGIKRSDAAKWILGTTANFVLGKPLPDKPVRQKSQKPVERFDGRLVDRHTASDGSEYLRFVFGETSQFDEGGNLDGSQVVDAEFAFLPNDAVVNVRSSSRVEPSISDTKVSLSFEFGVTVDQNLAKRRMEQLRKALHWEQVPVISDFDPKFNNEPLWFERIYQPFKLDPLSSPADK